MTPSSKSIRLENLFIKDEYVSEEVRNLATELDVLLVTASQLNRSSFDDTIEYDASHVAGGISQVNTADNVIGIFTTFSMRESGKYQIQFMKTRNSASTGEKLTLKYDISSMRITDAPPDDSLSDLGNRVLGSMGNLPTKAADSSASKEASVVNLSLDADPDDFKEKMKKLHKVVSRNNLDK